MFRILLILYLSLPLLAFAQWEFTEPMPTAREGLAVAQLDGKIYAIGGKNQWGYFALDIVEIFDTSTNRWTTGPPIVNSRIYSAAAVHDGRILLFGGRAGFWLVDEVEMYDPEIGHWEVVGNMYSREGLSATTYGDSIIVLGGKENMWTYSPYANIYDPISLCWGDSLPFYPIPRAGHGAVVIGDSLFILGGVAYGLLSNVSLYDGYDWQEFRNLPYELGNTGAAVIDNSIFVVGGNIGFEATNKVLQFCITDNSWLEIDTLSTAREYHGVIAYDDKLYTIGGGQGDYFDRDYLASVEVLDLSTNVVSPKGKGAEPELFSIANYPNPFSRYTNIQINIGYSSSNIQPLVIYDILGREVMRWDLPPGQGSQILRWDGLNNFGNPLPSGVYFLRITTGDIIHTQKITIVR